MNKICYNSLMVKTTKIAIFEGKEIRRHFDEKNEKWYFSVVDVIAALSESENPQVYWRVMKKRLTDVADTETMFRIIQSIPSPHAEPFKLWLARVGYERVEESEDPEKAIQRAMRFYLKRGYSQIWVNQRLKSIEIRKELTDEWENRGIKESSEFVSLTDEITFAWAGMKTKDYKKYKDLKKE